METPFVAIVGATGTGKSALALDLAEALAARGRSAEIVNADAMQLYRGMDVGTAKLPAHERRGIPHHLLDVLDPGDEASVAAYQREARATVAALQAAGTVPILVGGSGLYVSSVIHEFDFPGSDPAVRARLEAELESEGLAALVARLRAADPAAAAAIDLQNPRRVVRALEVLELAGTLVPGLPEDRAPWRPVSVIWLRLGREALVPRLDARVLGMWQAGLLEEVARLRTAPGGLGRTARRAIGYAQALAQLDGAMTEAEAIAETQSLTRRYARRQVSWFRRYRESPDHAFAGVDADAPHLLDLALRRTLGED